MGYKFKGRRFDCGSIEGFVEATEYVYETKFLVDGNCYKPLANKAHMLL